MRQPSFNAAPCTDQRQASEAFHRSGGVTALRVRSNLDRTATYLADDFTFEGPIAHYRSAEEFLTGSRPFETLRPGWTVRAVLSRIRLTDGDRPRAAGGYAGPARPIRFPSGSVKWPTTRSRSGARSGPILRCPPRLSAF